MKSFAVLVFIMLLNSISFANDYVYVNCGKETKKINMHKIQDIGYGEYSQDAFMYQGLAVIRITLPATFKYDIKTNKTTTEYHYVNIPCKSREKAEKEVLRTLCKWRKFYGASGFDLRQKLLKKTDDYGDLASRCKGL